MSDLELTIGEGDFTIEIHCVDENTGGNLDLTPFNIIELNIKTTDYNTLVSGPISLGVIGDPTEGNLAWTIIPGDVPTPAGQYYGKIRFEASGGGAKRKSRQFDIKVMRDLST